ncbi:MAG: AarF/UbiB family protein, partial [Candidatus Omnitrophica bacterium]|nr:AarF/UbiB family protein [Candidatus Omnitrophota bacterium]
MLDARSDSYVRLISRKPFKVVVSLITVVAFLFNTVSYDIAWAGRTPSELTSVGSDRAVSPVSPGIFKELNVETFNLPQSLGTVKDSWSPSGSAAVRQTVIHIQDAHCNYYAQHTIAAILEYLTKEYGISEVNLEGGAREYDLSTFTSIDDKEARERIADHFVKEGVVSGAEYFAANNPEKVSLWGVEDPKLYMENLKVYRDSLEYKDDTDKLLKNLNYMLTSLKMKIYPKDLLELDLKYNQYKAGNIEFKDYLNYLAANSKDKLIDIKAFPNIFLLNQALKEESGIDFNKANNERDRLIDMLGKKLSKNGLKELVEKTVEFKGERISQGEFYRYLVNKSKEAGLSVENFPDLEKYIVYISSYAAVDKAKIIDEVAALEKKIRDCLIRNEKERELDRLSRNLAILKNIFNISLTRADYQYYKSNEAAFAMKNYISFINREAPLCNINAKLDDGITRLDGYRADISKFYLYSFKRDEVFLKKMKVKKSAIIITGGFHTENLCEQLREKNIAYISLVPNFKTSEGYECPYYGLLAGKQDTLDNRITTVLGSSLAVASIWNALGVDVEGMSIRKQYQRQAWLLEAVGKNERVVLFRQDVDGLKEVVIDRGLNVVELSAEEIREFDLPRVDAAKAPGAAPLVDVGRITSSETTFIGIAKFLLSLPLNINVSRMTNAANRPELQERALIATAVLNKGKLEGYLSEHPVNLTETSPGQFLLNGDASLLAVARAAGIKTTPAIISAPSAVAAEPELAAPAQEPNVVSWFPDDGEWTQNAWLREAGIAIFVAGSVWTMLPMLPLAGLEGYVEYIISAVAAITYNLPNRTRALDPKVLSLTAGVFGAAYLLITNPILGLIALVGLMITHRHINLPGLSQPAAPPAIAKPETVNAGLFVRLRSGLNNRWNSLSPGMKIITGGSMLIGSSILIGLTLYGTIPAIPILTYMLMPLFSGTAAVGAGATMLGAMLPIAKPAASRKAPSVAPRKGVIDIPIVTTETRKRLIADRLGIDFDRMGEWERKNPAKAKIVNERLVEISQLVERNRVRLQKMAAEEIVVDPNDPQFANLYAETKEIIDDLLRAYGFNPANFNLFLMDSTSENAFAVNYGNTIGVNIGLIKFILEGGGSKDALAFVLAHEIRHVAQWIDDCVEGKTLDPFYSLLDQPIKEYDADLALELMDKAGYSVRDAGFFFDKLLERGEKKKPFARYFGFLSHPPTIDRLRKIIRSSRKYFWLNFFNKAKMFSTDARGEALNNRSKIRRFQEEVAACSTVTQAIECLRNAGTREEFIFALMVAIQHQTGVNVAIALQLFFSKFDVKESMHKEFYKALFTTIKQDMAQIMGPSHVRGWYEAAEGVYQELELLFASAPMSEIIKFFSIEMPRSMKFDIYGREMKERTDINYAAITSATSAALKSYIEKLARSKRDINLSELIELIDLFRMRRAEGDAYNSAMLSRDIESAFESMILAFLNILNEQVKGGKTVSDADLDKIFLLIEDLKGSYGTGEAAVSALCGFMKNATLENKIKIMEWVNKGDGEKANDYRDYFFHQMARNPSFIDILPGMGRDPRADIDALFSSPYFTKHAIFSEVRIGENQQMFRINMLMAALKNLKARYDLSDEAMLDLYEYVLSKMSGFVIRNGIGRIYERPGKFGRLRSAGGISAVAGGSVEAVYNELYDAIKWLKPLKARLATDPAIPQDVSDDIKTLIYFYNLGGVLGFRDIREEFGYIQGRASNGRGPALTHRDVEAFYNMLMSKRDGIEARYEEAENYKKDERWNKYTLPFALFLYADGAALDRDQMRYHGYDSDEKTRFGRFEGEFSDFSVMSSSLDTAYLRTPVERGRGVNRVLMSGEDAASLAGIFDYILLSDKDSGALLNELLSRLPPSVYRNFALYILFAEKVMARECGVRLDRSRIFELSYMQGAIDRLDVEKKKTVLRFLSRILPNMVPDSEMAWLNFPAAKMAGEVEDDEKRRIESEYRRDAARYYPAEYAEFGGPLSQMDIFTGLLGEKYILDNLIGSRSLTFARKLDMITKTFFGRRSNTRDRLLAELLEKNKGTITYSDIDSVLPKFNNRDLKEKYALLAFEKRRLEAPQDFDTLDKELKMIRRYFPRLSLTRDDILLQLIDEKATHPDDVKRVRRYLLRAPENIRRKAQAVSVFGGTAFDAYLAEQKPQDKLEFLLWVFRMTNEKPFFIKRFEHEYNINLDVLRDMLAKKSVGHYENIGESFMDEFLEKILIGEKGIFFDQDANDRFFVALYEKIMPGETDRLMKAVYDTTFSKADPDRKFEIVSALLKNYSKEREVTEGSVRGRAVRIFLSSLGLVGAKMGQFLSSNEDVPQDIRKELAELRDRAAPLSKDIIFDMIAKIYGSFDRSPVKEILQCIGRASVKVVYTAVLKDGRRVVIKMKRPDVEKRMEQDIAFLRSIISDPAVRSALEARKIKIPEQLADRISELIREEMNFSREVANQNRLADSLKPRLSLAKRTLNRIAEFKISGMFKTPRKKYNFTVPAIYKVENNTLIMEEAARGRSITERDEDGLIAAARELLRQIFIDGLYHADPHLGNIFIDDATGTIFFIDAGSAASISIANRYKLYHLMTALYDSDNAKALKFVSKIAGSGLPGLERGISAIVSSDENIAKQIVDIFKLLEDSGIKVDKDFMSILTCFGKGKQLFDKALRPKKKAQSVKAPPADMGGNFIPMVDGGMFDDAATSLVVAWEYRNRGPMYENAWRNLISDLGAIDADRRSAVMAALKIQNPAAWEAANKELGTASVTTAAPLTAGAAEAMLPAEEKGAVKLPEKKLESWLVARGQKPPIKWTVAGALMDRVLLIGDFDTSDQSVQNNISALFMRQEPGGAAAIEEVLDGCSVKPQEVLDIILERRPVEVRQLGKGGFRYVNHIIIETTSRKFHFTASTNYDPEEEDDYLRTEQEYKNLKEVEKSLPKGHENRFQKPFAMRGFRIGQINYRVIFKEYIPGTDLYKILQKRLSADLTPDNIDSLLAVMKDFGSCFGEVYTTTGRFITDARPDNFVADDSELFPTVKIIDAEDLKGIPPSKILYLAGEVLTSLEAIIDKHPMSRRIELTYKGGREALRNDLWTAFLTGFVESYKGLDREALLKEIGHPGSESRETAAAILGTIPVMPAQAQGGEGR